MFSVYAPVNKHAEAIWEVRLESWCRCMYLVYQWVKLHQTGILSQVILQNIFRITLASSK